MQYGWNIFDRRMKAEIFPYCAAQEIGVMAYGSLAYGMLSGAFHAGMQFEESDWRSRGGMLGNLNLFRTFVRPGAFSPQPARRRGSEAPRGEIRQDPGAIRAAMDFEQPVVGTALVGFREPAEVTENLEALGWNLLDVDMTEIDAILSRHDCVTMPPGWLED